MRGPLLIEKQRMMGFLFREMLGRAHYPFPGTVTISAYQTQGGAEVPFVWSIQKGEIPGLTVDAESAPSDKSIRSLESWLRSKERASGPVAAIEFHRGKERFVARKGIVCLPIGDLV